MATYKVYCGMRSNNGKFPAYVDTSTMFRTVTVEARDIHDARSAAIDECYRQWGNAIEHVKPLRVTLVDVC